MSAETRVLLLTMAIVVVLAGVLVFMGREDAPNAGRALLFYCAAGIRPAVAPVIGEYESRYGAAIQVQYGGSGTLLSNVRAARTGDLYLAGDDSYIEKASAKGLVAESLPLAKMRPVIAVRKDNDAIRAIEDLLKPGVRVAVGNPGAAAIGRIVQKLLAPAGLWERLEARVEEDGVFKPTVPEIANDVKIGAADAGIIWDATVKQYPSLKAIRVDLLDAGTQNIAIAVLASCTQPTAALRFVRYLGARDRGLLTFEQKGYEPVEGDVWAERPEITFFCGAVNRRAVEDVVKAFEKREGATVNTVYNGCGILTAQMRTINQERGGKGFPDVYMACDRYYLETVREWFQDDVDVSDADIVIAVPKGNPKQIQSLTDLAEPGLRVSVGQPQQCTIGVLTRTLLEEEGLSDQVMKNVVMQTASSAMLVPTVTTKSVDATLAYVTDTIAGRDKVDTVRIKSAHAKAVQPFSIARSSKHKHLGRRLFRAVADARGAFESAGFNFRAGECKVCAPEPKSP